MVLITLTRRERVVCTRTPLGQDGQPLPGTGGLPFRGYQAHALDPLYSVQEIHTTRKRQPAISGLLHKAKTLPPFVTGNRR